MKKWRLIETPPMEGALNMAIDSYLFKKVLSGEQPPFLRLYSWKSPCISLGYFQKLPEVLNAMVENKSKTPVVRRVTGGRAVYHEGELTYSLAAGNPDAQWCAARETSFQAISLGLLAALKVHIPNLSYSRSKVSSRQLSRGVDCFKTSSKFEIEYGGKKLVGSAQRRLREGFLQHGSILILQKSKDFFSGRTRFNSGYKDSHSISIEEILGKTLSPEDLAENFASRFGLALNIEFERKNLTDMELREASLLCPEFQLGL